MVGVGPHVHTTQVVGVGPYVHTTHTGGRSRSACTHYTGGRSRSHTTQVVGVGPYVHTTQVVASLTPHLPAPHSTGQCFMHVLLANISANVDCIMGLQLYHVVCVHA